MAIFVQEFISLKPYNTFGVDVRARWFTEVNTIDELKEALRWAQHENVYPFILGGGSNLLWVADPHFLVIKLQLLGFSIQEFSNEVHMKVAAGENWHQTVLKSLELGLGGIENLSLIPGTVGAAPIQNIGAYGVELRQVFVKLEALETSTHDLKTFTAETCNFGYRDSIFKQEAKGKYIITSVTMRLKKNADLNIGYGDIAKTLEDWGIPKPDFNDVSRAVIHIRQSKLPDPKEIGNSGSFFKNPETDKQHFDLLRKEFPDMPGYALSENKVKVPAGWLIEQAGWKGYREGEAGVHARQALVLVNYGHATGQEILALSRKIQDSVQQKFGIWLQAEVNILP